MVSANEHTTSHHHLTSLGLAPCEELARQPATLELHDDRPPRRRVDGAALAQGGPPDETAHAGARSTRESTISKRERALVGMSQGGTARSLVGAPCGGHAVSVVARCDDQISALPCASIDASEFRGEVGGGQGEGIWERKWRGEARPAAAQTRKVSEQRARARVMTIEVRPRRAHAANGGTLPACA